MAMNNSEDQTLKLAPTADAPNVPNTNPISLDEFYVQFREERRTNELFRDEMRDILSRFAEESRANFGRVFQRLDAIEHEQRLMRREMIKLAGAQLQFDARLDATEEDVALLKAA